MNFGYMCTAGHKNTRKIMNFGYNEWKVTQDLVRNTRNFAV